MRVAEVSVVRILIVTSGTREDIADIAPLTGLGTAIRSTGHSVAIATHEVFANLVTACGLEFRALPGEPHQDMAREDVQQ